MTLSILPSFVQRIALRFLTANSLTHIVSILLVFVPIRVFLSLKHGMVPEGDGAVETGVALGRIWLRELTLQFVATGDGPVADFLRERPSQLLYPLLISLQKPVGWDIETHLLVLNTTLGSVLLVVSYAVALRLHGKAYAVLVALLMCALTPLYWIARFGIVDNLFYAILPLFALSVVRWQPDKSRRSFTLLILGFGALALTRPESFLVIVSAVMILLWDHLRRYVSPRVLALTLSLSLATGAIGTIALVSSSPPLQKTLLSRGHISWGLAMSAHTLYNRGGMEYDRLTAKYSDIETAERLTTDELSYRMSTDALAVIKDEPLRYVLKIPLRGLALLFPWTYQPWSLPHIVYEAVYTSFLVVGLVLLVRRGGLQTPALVVLTIPLAIWFFLSVYGIDNDLKHRNGILVGLNLIAPLGYFLPPGNRKDLARG